MSLDALAPWAPYLGLVGVISVVLAVAGAAALPMWLVRVSPDRLLQPPDVSWARRGLGLLAVLAGVAMLVLPGQGLLTIAVGLWLMDLPLARRMTRRVWQVPAIQRGVDALRRKAGAPPMHWPSEDAEEDAD